MASFTTTVNTPTIYRVKRVLSDPLGVGWLYQWKAVSSKYPNDDTFYRIEGIDKADEDTTWISQPYATFTFLRTTETGEKFSVVATVKELIGNNEICTQIVTETVVVSPQPTPLSCGSITTSTDCIKAGIDYEYQFCCDASNPVDEIIFDVRNARVFNLTGTEYMTTNNISVTDFSSNCASIVVRWNQTDPTPPGYYINAYARKGTKYSDVEELSNIYAILQNPVVAIISDDSMAYESGNNIISLRLSKITRYPDDYKIVVSEKHRDKTPDGSWTSYGTIWSGLASSLKPAYTNDFNYTLALPDPYVSGDPLGFEIQFKVEIYECSDLGTCDSTKDCLTSQTVSKEIDLVYCPDTISLGPINATTDPCVDDITWGSISWSNEYCYDTVWSVGQVCKRLCWDTIWVWTTVCKRWCWDTTWSWVIVCKRWCWETAWVWSVVCKRWCWDTYWVWTVVCKRWCYDTLYLWTNPCYIISTETEPTLWSYVACTTTSSPTHA